MACEGTWATQYGPKGVGHKFLVGPRWGVPHARREADRLIGCSAGWTEAAKNQGTEGTPVSPGQQSLLESRFFFWLALHYCSSPCLPFAFNRYPKETRERKREKQPGYSSTTTTWTQTAAGDIWPKSHRSRGISGLLPCPGRFETERGGMGQRRPLMTCLDVLPVYLLPLRYAYVDLR